MHRGEGYLKLKGYLELDYKSKTGRIRESTKEKLTFLPILSERTYDAKEAMGRKR